MKHNAAWFFNFFNNLYNWTRGRRYSNGRYCAIGHLQSYEGKSNSELDDSIPDNCSYATPLVQECANTVFDGHIESIWRTNDREGSPKDRILHACRKAILRENPECQLGKEYDI